MKYIQKYLDKRLANKLLERLLSRDKKEWMYFYHCFNTWQFPPTFYDLIPEWWGRPLKGDRMYFVISKVISEIRNEISEKELLRFNNVRMGKMTNDEYEYWWEIKGDDDRMMAFYKRQNYYHSVKFWQDNVFKKIESLNISRK